MGTFAGHAIPGTGFIIWGVVWYGSTLRQMARAARRREAADVAGNAPADAWKVSAAMAPGEPYLKMSLPVAGAIGELWWASWRLVDSSITNYQHATMYLAFALTGVADWLERRNRLPRGSAYAALAGAFSVEALLFLGHPNPPGLEVRVHQLLVVTMLLQVGALCGESYFRTPVFTLFRSVALIWQGTWFWQIAFMLYVAEYPGGAHAPVMLATLFFAWHGLLVAGLVGAGVVWVTAASRRSAPPP